MVNSKMLNNSFLKKLKDKLIVEEVPFPFISTSLPNPSVSVTLIHIPFPGLRT